jgi:hypothetical protein
MCALHVTPIDDLREHLLLQQCWCRPKVLDDDDGTEPLIVHNSADGREYFEPDHVPEPADA